MRVRPPVPDSAAPHGLPLTTDQVSALAEGSPVIALLTGEQAADEFTVHREGGRIYARSKVDVAAGVIDRQKVLTFVTPVWLPKPPAAT